MPNEANTHVMQTKNAQTQTPVDLKIFGMEGAQTSVLHNGAYFDVKMEEDGNAEIYDSNNHLVTSFKPNFKQLTTMNEPKKPNFFLSALKNIFGSGSIFSMIFFLPLRLLFSPITVPLKMYAYSKAYKEYTAKYAEITKQNNANVASNKLELFNAAKTALSNMKKTTVDAKSGPNVELKPSNNSGTPNAPIETDDAYIDFENGKAVFASLQQDAIKKEIAYNVAYTDLQKYLEKITPTIHDTSSAEEKNKATAIQDIRNIIKYDEPFYVSEELIKNTNDTTLGAKINNVIKTLGEKTEADRRVNALNGAIIKNGLNLTKAHANLIHNDTLQNISQQYSSLNNLNLLGLQNVYRSNFSQSNITPCTCNHTELICKPREINKKNTEQSHQKT